jgi:hypothetical protein
MKGITMLPIDCVKLPKVKSKNGYTYIQLHRTDKAAIYEQKVAKEINGDVGRTVGYEVFRVRTCKEYSLVQKSGENKGHVYNYPIAEKFPSNEDGGQNLWCYNSLQSAMSKFHELDNEKRK